MIIAMEQIKGVIMILEQTHSKSIDGQGKTFRP